MKNLHQLGLIGYLNRMVVKERKPIFGICFGSQPMAKESYDFGHHTGLGWFDGLVIRLERCKK
jgi:glutamine amidotransferase